MHSSLYEQFRLSRLNRLGLLDTPPQARFDRITRIASTVYGTEVALVSLLDAKRQWFKSRQGLGMDSTERSIAFCNHTILQDEVFVVYDASADERFANNPLVAGAPYIRFYAGVPLREPTGFRIGSLCVIDSRPRPIGDAGDFDTLKELASLVEEEIARVFYLDRESSAPMSAGVQHLVHRVQASPLEGEDGGGPLTKASVESLLSELMELSASPVGTIVELAGDAQFRPLAVRGMTPVALADHIGQEALADLAKDAHNDGSPDQAILPILLSGKIAGLLILANRAGGYPASVREQLEPVTYAVGNLLERICLKREQDKQRAALRKSRHYDLTTGLPNQGHLISHLDRRLKDDKRPLAVCHIDLDGFASAVAGLSSASEEQLLRTVARRLSESLRHGCDFVARIGVDEFVVVLDGNAEAAICQRMLSVIATPIQIESQAIALSASMGIALFPQHDTNAGSLLRHAFQAMLTAKESGRGGYRFFDLASHQGKLAQAKLLDEVEQGIAKRQFELFFQPKIHLASNRVSGFEGLIRWHHPEEGLLAPDRFLPQIEASDCDLRLGNYVLREGVATLKTMAGKGRDFSLSINLSAHHFLSDGFVDDLRQCLQGCPANLIPRLTLEILETTVLDDAAAAIETAQACRELGVRLSLDDFGTGYSSLSHFRRLPLDEVKIDRSFIRDMMLAPDDALIVQTIIALTRQFHRQVVAEGIEDSDSADRLRELGCDLGQGYYYCRPRPLDEILAWAEVFEGQPAGHLVH